MQAAMKICTEIVCTQKNIHTYEYICMYVWTKRKIYQVNSKNMCNNKVIDYLCKVFPMIKENEKIYKKNIYI